MKKLAFLVALMLITGLLTAVLADGGECGTGLTWDLDLETGILTVSGNGAMADFEYGSRPWEARAGSITKAVIGAGVTHVGNHAFRSCGSLSEVDLPSGLLSIGENAFAYCGALSEIDLPEELQTIGNHAFVETCLISVEIPDTVRQMGFGVFGTINTLQSAKLSAGMTTVPEKTFEYCRNLQSITVPEGVVSIADKAFYGCQSLSTVSLPADLESVGSGAFSDCGIETVNFGGTREAANGIHFEIGNTSLTGAVWHCGDGDMYGVGPVSGTFGDSFAWAIDGDGVLTVSGTGDMMDFEYGKRPWEARAGSITKAVIGADVTRVGNHAFRSCGSLSEAVLPSGMLSIGENAFAYCGALDAIDLPEKLQTIGNHAFVQTGLTSVEIPDTVLQMGFGVFGTINTLQSAKLSAGMTTVPEKTFEYCRNLQSITVPEGVVSIADKAFYGCQSLFTVSLPADLESVGSGAFSDCGIETVNFGGTREAANGIHFEIGNTSLTGAVWHCGDGDMNGVGPVSGTLGDGFVWAIDGDGVLTVSGTGDMMDFEYGKRPWEARAGSITKAVIGADVTRVGNHAFRSCGSLSEAVLPSGLLSIGENAFAYCESLDAIDLPEKLQTIGNHAFVQTGLTSVEIPDTVRQMGFGVFGAINTLQSAKLSAGMTTVPEKTFEYCQNLQSITVQEGVVSIADKAFYGCQSLSTVSLPADLESVGIGAFSDCGIETVNFGGMREAANGIHFEMGNTALTGALWHCSDGIMVGIGPVSGGCGTSVAWNLDGTVLTITGSGDMADYDDAADAPWAERKSILTEIVVSEGVTGVGENAFPGCPALTKLTLPEGLTSIVANAFVDCPDLGELSLPESLTSIGTGAFSGCEAITEVTIPENVATVGEGAFTGCGLRDLYLKNTDLTEESAAEYCPWPEGCKVHLYSKVTFDGNGDYGLPVMMTVERGTEVNAPNASFQRTNYRIRSWNTERNGSGTRYWADAPIQITWNTTLYAQWDNFVGWCLEVYDILNDTHMTGGVIHIMAVMDDGSGSSVFPYGDCDGQGNYGAAGHVELTLTAEAAEGYHFYGWYDSEPDEGAGSQLMRPVSLLSREAVQEVVLSAEDGVIPMLTAAFIPEFGEAELKLPEDLTKVGENAFLGCAAKSISVPDKVTIIGNGAFAECEALRQIHLPKNCDVTPEAFRGCNKLAVYAVGGGSTATALQEQTNIFFISE